MLRAGKAADAGVTVRPVMLSVLKKWLTWLSGQDHVPLGSLKNRRHCWSYFRYPTIVILVLRGGGPKIFRIFMFFVSV